MNCSLVDLRKEVLVFNFFEKASKKYLYRDHSFITFVKFSEKLTFVTPWYAHARMYFVNVIINERINKWFYRKHNPFFLKFFQIFSSLSNSWLILCCLNCLNFELPWNSFLLYRGVFITLSNIWHGTFCERCKRLSPVNQFWKKTQSLMFYLCDGKINKTHCAHYLF